MILKALYDYYNRCEGLSAKGLEQKEIGYLIVIDKDGTFVRIESRMKDKKTLSFMICTSLAVFQLRVVSLLLSQITVTTS